MSISVSFQACQQDAQRHLMAVGAVQRIGPILGPAGLSIVPAQHCRAIFMLSTLVALSKLQTVIRDRAVPVCFIGLPYGACPSSRLCREAAKSLYPDLRINRGLPRLTFCRIVQTFLPCPCSMSRIVLAEQECRSYIGEPFLGSHLPCRLRSPA